MSMIGKSLMHYQITGLIGKGGMGEVYQAKDQKLGRDIAIKILPEEFARDTDRVARFEREAKLLASLNHPNIAAIHGLEESDGTHFLVLELVEGEALSDRIKAGPVPVEEALKLGLQIAEALEAAHDKGVIHRDLKPANIKVTPDGKVKVLDFGLAKAYAGGPENINLSNSPTLSDAATQQGVILGTAAYMSPEQARGETVDKRADIWAFGVVLYEMLTGRQAFTGKTVSDTLASVLAREPQWQSLPSNLHSRIRILLERCLEKDPKNRYSGISDARVDIQRVLSDPGGVFAQPVSEVVPGAKSRRMLLWASITVILIVIAGIVVWNAKAPETRKVTRFDYELPESQQFSHFYHQLLAVSPDGTQFVYSTTDGLYLRSENEMAAKFVAGTDEIPSFPFFSPDGQWIGYFSNRDRKLKKISVNGGAPIALCDVPEFTGASWGRDDMIVFGQARGPIFRIPANGGKPEILVEPDDMLILPQILPDGKTVLFSQWKGNTIQVVVQSLKTGERRGLFPGHSARYLPTGHIVYAVENDLFAVPFDLDGLKVSGGSVPVVEGVALNMDGVLMNYAVSDSGTLAYIPGAARGTVGRTLVWVDRKGQEEPIEAEPNMYQFPKVSPDGNQVALTVNKRGNQDIWVWDLVNKTLKRLTFNEDSDSFPVWTADGKRIIFRSAREKTGIYIKAANGTGEAELIAPETRQALLPFCLSGDGKTLVAQQVLGMSEIDIGTLSMDDDHTQISLLHDDYVESHPQVSPDGKWIAYCSAESDRPEIFVRPFPNVDDGKWQISTNGGNSPLWSPDGRELFYLIGEAVTEAVMRVEVQTVPTFKHGKPEKLFSGTYVGYFPGDFPWAIHPDGKRFLLMKEYTDDASAKTTLRRKINVVLNWFEELKQRVPVP
jgi:serine/threonine protein kinase